MSQTSNPDLPDLPDPLTPPSDHRRRLYGRRLGRPLKLGRESALALWLPRLRVTVPEAGLIDPAELFGGAVDDVWLEVGFGSGEHLLAQTRANPRVGLIGCEPFINGMAALLVEIDREPARAGQIRVLMDDAIPLIKALPDGSLGRVFVLFPDPWPKARHHKRRFIAPATLDQLARVNCGLRAMTKAILPGPWSMCPTIRPSSPSVRRPNGVTGRPTGRRPAMRPRPAPRAANRLFSPFSGAAPEFFAVRSGPRPGARSAKRQKT